ncbi:hypothetical protein MASR2M41_15160 [Flammeovirgaceae bacterium]
MELRDLIVTPIIIFLVYAGAYWIRPRVTDSINRKYFIPALTVRIIGALAVGFIYQFYYHGGDTYNFHTHGSRHVWEAFMDNPVTGIKLLFSSGQYDGDVFRYASQIPFYRDPSSYTIIKISSIFDLITFSSYSATAVLFAVVSFVGLWFLFKVFYVRYPELHKELAIACFFIPSVFFWGSGLLKDTITLSALGLIIYSTYYLFVLRTNKIITFICLGVSIYILYVVKIYILLILIPTLIIWIFLLRLSHMRRLATKIILAPIVILLAISLAGLSLVKASEDNPKYALDKLAKTAKVTAYDIRFWSGKDAGSGYALGELDGTFASVLKLGPSAINVTLFRPYLWETKNPLMLISSIESFFLLVLVLVTLIKGRLRVFRTFTDPTILFCLLFSLVFAFAVGVSTFNFGTLSRYKIPMLPIFLIALILINYKLKNFKKLSSLD